MFEGISGAATGLVRGSAPLAGLLVLGVGDAIASVVGVLVGRTRWPGTRKTVEGSTAALCTMLAWLVLLQ